MESGNGSVSTPELKKKEPSDRHVAVPSSSAGPRQTRFSISDFWVRLTLWWNLLWQKMPGKRQKRMTAKEKERDRMIPKERNGVSLTRGERRFYEILLDIVEARRLSCTPKPRIVVITDLAKDYDDLAAMVVLKELHRLGVVELLGFIANLEPAANRALFGRGALDHLGLRTIPIATGTSGYPPKETKRHKVEEYEFEKCPFMADKSDHRLKAKDSDEALTGEHLLFDLCSNAKKSGQKLTLLLISSLEDIHTFSSENVELMRNSVSNIVLQGGYEVTLDGKLKASTEANNNRYDLEAAEKFHALMQELKIKSTVYTRTAAIAATMEPEIFTQLAKTGNRVGEHLWTVQKAQDVSFYTNASQEDPLLRFHPDRDQRYFLKNRTNWYKDHSDEKDKYPVGEQVSEFTKVVVYDALAAIGVSGDDALEALNVLDINNSDEIVTVPDTVRELKERHKVVGYEKKKLVEGKDVTEAVAGIHVDNMVTALKAFLKGSLISSPPNEETTGASDIQPS